MGVAVRVALYYLCLQWTCLLQYYNADGCAPGWTPYRRFKVCFKLYNDIKLDWSEARHYCILQDAYLTDMRDYAEQKFINESILTNLDIAQGVWLGGEDEGNDDWSWTSGARMDIDLFLWRIGNPDNGLEIELPHFGENCLQMSTDSGFRGQLNDYYCSKKLYFVCKNTDMFNITSPIPLLSSTSSSRMTKQPIKSTNYAIPILIALVCVLIVVLMLVFIIVTVSRKRNRHINTGELSPNEHIYTVLNGVFRSSPSDRLQQGAGITQSTDDLLRGQYAEANVYASSGTDNPAYQTLQGVSSSEHVYNSLGPDASNTDADDVNAYVEPTRSKSSYGYIDMDGEKRNTEQVFMPNRSASGYIDLNADCSDDIATTDFVEARGTNIKQNKKGSRDIDSRDSILTNDGYVVNDSVTRAGND